jgi:two-component system, NarL family, response regulator NreC
MANTEPRSELHPPHSGEHNNHTFPLVAGMKNGKRLIVLAEDHTIVRKGLRTLLSANPNFGIIGEASDGREAVKLAEKLKPDLVLIDLSMPRMDGTQAIQQIKKDRAATKVLVLTMHNTEDTIVAALEAGADGYILKDDTHAELLLAIESVLGGKHYLSPSISGRVIKGYLEGRKTFKPLSPWDTLTQREREVLKLIAEGYRNRQIADQLCISLKTVEKHRAHLRGKLDLHTASALTKYAAERGLIRD